MKTIVTINAGSSSLKIGFFGITSKNVTPLIKGNVSFNDALPVLTLTKMVSAPLSLSKMKKKRATEHFDLPLSESLPDLLEVVLDILRQHYPDLFSITAMAHRIVHGGDFFKKATYLDDEKIVQLETLSPFAPLHQPVGLEIVQKCQKLLPEIYHIACFDTAFHGNNDPLFTTYALPKILRDLGLRRFGFHGLSFAWIARVLKEKYPSLSKGRVVVAHLGSGSSLCALYKGQSIDTTMGLTALDGLMMETRCGSIDPGIILHLIKNKNYDVKILEHLLYHDSGLQGLSEGSRDVRILLEKAQTEPKAKFALDLFCLKVAQHMARMVISLKGLDGIVFTGGIGEHSPWIRRRILHYFSALPFHMSLKQKNIITLSTNEEYEMAHEAHQLLYSHSRM